MVLFSGCRAGIDREALLRYYQEYGSIAEGGGGGVVQSDHSNPVNPVHPSSPGRSIPEIIPPVPVPPPPVPLPPPPPIIVPEPLPAPPIQSVPPILGKDGMPIPAQKFPGPPWSMMPVPPPVPMPPPLISSRAGVSRPREERESRHGIASMAESIGESCHSRDTFNSETLCLGIDYVTYREGLEQDKETENEILLQIEEVNRIWKVCEIQFQVDHHIPVDPAEHQARDSVHDLDHRIAEFIELNEIRKHFATDSELLVVLTGKWDRSGSLGAQLANAWTTPPGDGLYGVIMERPMGMQPHLLAHELGHYLGLTHADRASELMYPIIYPNSIAMTPEQCVSARTAIEKYWQKMLR